MEQLSLCIASLLTSFPRTVMGPAMWAGLVSGFVTVLLWLKMGTFIKGPSKSGKWWLEAMLWAALQSFIAGFVLIIADSWENKGAPTTEAIAEAFVWGFQGVAVGVYSLFIPLIGPPCLRLVRHMAMVVKLVNSGT